MAGNVAADEAQAAGHARGLPIDPAPTLDRLPALVEGAGLGLGGECREAGGEGGLFFRRAPTGGGAAEAQLDAEMRVYEQYFIGMLTNLTELPLARINNMLRMFVPASGGDRGYDRSEAELQRFLQRLVEDGKLELSAGMYKIRR